MADKKADDPDFIARMRRWRIRMTAASFGAAALLLPAGWYVVDEVALAEHHFNTAAQGQDYATAQRYIGSLETDDLAPYYRRAAEAGDERLFSLLLEQDKRVGRYNVYRALYDLGEELSLAAAKGGHLGIINLIHAEDTSFFPERNIFNALAENGHTVQAIRLFNDWGIQTIYVEDGIAAAAKAGHFDTATGMAAALPLDYMTREEKLVIALHFLDAGETEKMVAFAEAAGIRELGIRTAMTHLARKGETEAMLDVAYRYGLSNQSYLSDIAGEALAARQEGPALALAEHFQADLTVAYSQAYAEAVRRENIEALRFLDARHTLGADEYVGLLYAALGRENMDISLHITARIAQAHPGQFTQIVTALFKDTNFVSTHSDFAFRFAQEAPIPQDLHPAIAGMFTGTMDDALRIRWGLSERPGQAPRP